MRASTLVAVLVGMPLLLGVVTQSQPAWSATEASPTAAHVGTMQAYNKAKLQLTVRFKGLAPDDFAVGATHVAQWGTEATAVNLKVVKVGKSSVVFALPTHQPGIKPNVKVTFLPPSEPAPEIAGILPLRRPRLGASPLIRLTDLEGPRVDLGLVNGTASEKTTGLTSKESGLAYALNPVYAFGPRRGGVGLQLAGGKQTRTVEPEGFESDTTTFSPFTATLSGMGVVADTFVLGLSYASHSIKGSGDDGYELTVKGAVIQPALGILGSDWLALLSFAPKSSWKVEESGGDTEIDQPSQLGLLGRWRVSAATTLTGELRYNLDDGEHDEREDLGFNERLGLRSGVAVDVATSWTLAFALLRNESSFDLFPRGLRSEVPTLGASLGIIGAFGRLEARFDVEHGSGAVERPQVVEATGDEVATRKLERSFTNVLAGVGYRW